MNTGPPNSTSVSSLDLSGKLVLFTTIGCFYSTQLKIYFKSKNVPYHEIQISKYPVGFLAVDKMLQNGAPKSLPNVFCDGAYLGVCLCLIDSVLSVDASGFH